MKVSGAAKRETRERERRAQEGSENCVYFKGEVERKALNCEQLQRGRGGGGRRKTGVLADKRNVVSLGQRNRHFKIRRSYANQILPSVI